MGNSKSKSSPSKSGSGKSKKSKSSKSKNRSQSRHGSSSSNSERDKQLKQLFAQYCEDPDEPITEGVIISKFQTLLDDMGVDMTTLDAMFVLYFFEAAEIGSLSYDQWCAGFDTLVSAADEISLKSFTKGLKSKSAKVRRDEGKYTQFYIYCFNTAKESDAARILATEVALPMLELLLCDYPKMAKLFSEFVQEIRPVDGGKAALSRDEWSSLLTFVRQHNLANLDTYSVDDAWPILIDDFVEWAQQKRQRDGETGNKVTTGTAGDDGS